MICENDILCFTVSGITEPLKIKEYLIKHLGFSTALIARVKYEGVFQNGTAVHMRSLVQNGDKITVHMPKESGSEIMPLDIPLEILFEDKDILAVNKPVGMPTHPARGNKLPTLAAAVMNYLGEGAVFRAVSRLDKDTSGIVLIAKNAYSAAVLGRAMKNGEIIKEYTAYVEGIPDKHGIIEAPIERVCEGDIHRCVREDGKYAKTEYELLKITDSGNSVISLRLHTGRTHQIRVHMAYIGHPLVNDELYSSKMSTERYLLHCHKLEFDFVGKGHIVISSPPSTGE